MTESSINDRLNRGEIVAVGSKLYAHCVNCGQVVRVNKPFLGGAHFCLTEDEKYRKDLLRRRP